MDSFYSYKETKIPVRVITDVKRKFVFDAPAHGRGGARSALASFLIVGLMFGTASQAVLIGAEAHMVSVTARIMQGEESPVAPQPQTDGEVVLNEILPNPEGLDSEDGLLGEWVELYNLGNSEVDVAGWYIKDAAGNTKIISLANTHTGDTLIGANGSGSEWLVVFMNASVLNNTGDTVFLYNGGDILKDSHAFGASQNDGDSDSETSPGEGNADPTGEEDAGREGKSVARIPDGTGEWVDPIPTPGGPNRMEETTPVSTGGGSETPAEAPTETEESAVTEEPPIETPIETPEETPATTEEPSVATEEPPIVAEEPSATTEELPATTEEPSAGTEEPSAVTEEPPAATEEPVAPPDEAAEPPAVSEETLAP